MDNRNEWRIFYATSLEGPQAYTFWTASINIDPDLIINDLARKLVAEYAKSHQAFSVEIFKPHKSITHLPSTAVKSQFPNYAALIQNADSVSFQDLVRDALPERQSIVVILRQVLPVVQQKHRRRLSVPSDFLLRPELVKSLYTHACEHNFFLVHGTPGSGKTTLCQLLYNYILEQEDADVQMMGIWAKRRTVSEDFDYARLGELVLSLDDATDGNGSRRWILFDEGQSTYDDPRLWNGLFKLPAQRQSLVIVVFALYENAQATKGGTRIVGTPNVIENAQRMTMWPTNNGIGKSGTRLPIPGLYLLRSEYDEMVELYQRNHSIPYITNDFKQWMFDITTGHIGAVNSVLTGIGFWKLTEISMDTFLGSDNTRQMLDYCAMGKAFARGLPNIKAISSPSNASAIAYVRRLLQAPDGCISYTDSSHVPEDAMDAHHSGWVVLHDSDASSITHFPSLFHRYRCSWLLNGRFELSAEIEDMDMKEFIIAVIGSFSQTTMHNAERHVDSHGKSSIPEAQYRNELYRAAYELTGGRGIWLSPEFGTSSREGHIDFFVGGSKGWGIGILRQGDRTFEHLQRTEPDEAYRSWIPTDVMKECILIHFGSDTNTQPRYQCTGCNLFYVIFDSAFHHFRIEDCVHGEVAKGYLKQ